MPTESAAPDGADGVKEEPGAAPETDAGSTEPKAEPGTSVPPSMENLTEEQKHEAEAAEYRRQMLAYEQEKAKYDAEMAVYNKKVKEAHKFVAEKVTAANNVACRPMPEVPFKTYDDAITRLLPYHVFEAPDEEEAHHGLVPPIMEKKKREDAKGDGKKAKDGAPDEKKEKDGAPDDSSAEDTTEEVEVCPARSRTQAWSELCAQYTKDFKRELDDKRRRVDAFDAGLYSTRGETDKTEETNGGEPGSVNTSLRPEEWYVAEMLAFEETKRRHQKLQAEVRHAEAEVRRFRDEQLAKLAGTSGLSTEVTGGQDDGLKTQTVLPPSDGVPGVPVADQSGALPGEPVAKRLKTL